MVLSLPALVGPYQLQFDWPRIEGAMEAVSQSYLSGCPVIQLSGGSCLVFSFSLHKHKAMDWQSLPTLQSQFQLSDIFLFHVASKTENQCCKNSHSGPIFCDEGQEGFPMRTIKCTGIVSFIYLFTMFLGVWIQIARRYFLLRRCTACMHICISYKYEAGGPIVPDGAQSKCMLASLVFFK